MGRKDTLSTEYLSDNARFADICNYCLFDGQDVIQAEDLREMDTKEFLELAGLSGKGQQIQRIRDILKGAVIRSTGDCTYLILGVENQTEIHYAMPVRGMIYDGINYGSQVNEISRRHRKAHNLNSPADITDFEKFRTSVGLVLEVIKHQDSEQEMEQILTREAALHNIEYAAAKVIEGFTDIKMDQDEKEEFNMCKAWTDHYQSGVREGLEQGREEGRKEGREQGELRAIIKSSIKKFCRNIAADEAADMLEENVTLIERIYDAARMCAPDYDVDKIYAILQQ